MKKRLPLLLVLALVIGGTFAVRRIAEKREESDSSNTLKLHGNVDIRQVELAFRVPGRLASVAFDEGDVVTTGVPVATLDDEPYRQALQAAQAERAQAEAALTKLQNGSRPQEVAAARANLDQQQALSTLLQAEFRRKEALVPSGAIAKQEFDDIRSRLDQALAAQVALSNALSLVEEGPRQEDIAAAKAALGAAAAHVSQAETSLADTKLIAPGTGVVLTRVREPGSIVSAGQTVLTLSLVNPVWVRAYVSEPDLGRVHPGAPAEVYTDSRPETPYLEPVPRWHDFRRMPLPPGIRTRRDGTEPG